MDYAEKQTDIEVAKIESHLKSVYNKTANELQEKANKYFDDFAERYEKEHNAFLQGKYTAQEFKLWYYTQVGRGEHWQTLKTDAALKMTEINQQAAAYINSKTPGVYALNANFTAYEIEKGSGIAFNLVNEDTVRELALSKNHSEFRVLSVNPKRDYEWNQKRIQNELLSGILQGKSIDKLADGFLNVMGSNRGAAIRNARTAVTSAQNGGRQHTFDTAEQMGIEIEKEWIATQDGRTRDSHRMLDGVIVKNSEAFPNKLMYPGDPDGEPEEVYNCRCSMRAIMPKYETSKRTENTEESYRKWLEMKEKDNDYMSKSFRPAFSDKSVEKKIGETVIELKRVTNSSFELYAESNASKRSKAVRLSEKQLRIVKSEVGDKVDFPPIAVVDFESKGWGDSIGGYNKNTGFLFLNSKYDTVEKIQSYLIHEPGWFSNTEATAPIKHELGHKFYYNIIDGVAKNEKISYNKAQNLVEERLINYLKAGGVNISKDISGYASYGYEVHRYGEIVAESFSAYNKNDIATGIIDMYLR